MTMKPTQEGVAMMEVIAVETAPTQIFVLNVHAMMEGHCHLIYPVSQRSIFQISRKVHRFLIIEPDGKNSIFDILRESNIEFVQLGSNFALFVKISNRPLAKIIIL